MIPSSFIIQETSFCNCFCLISALLKRSEQNFISTPDEISPGPYKMSFTSPSLLETFHLIYPMTACFYSFIVILWPRLHPHCLRHLLEVTAEDTATNETELLMPTLLRTRSPFSSEHQLCLNYIAQDLGPLWCLHDIPVTLRINTDSLVTFQLRCPTWKGNWIAVCQGNIRSRTLLVRVGCMRYWICWNRVEWLHRAKGIKQVFKFSLSVYEKPCLEWTASSS